MSCALKRIQIGQGVAPRLTSKKTRRHELEAFNIASIEDGVCCMTRFLDTTLAIVLLLIHGASFIPDVSCTQVGKVRASIRDAGINQPTRVAVRASEFPDDRIR